MEQKNARRVGTGLWERNIRNAICRSRNKCAFTQTAARLYRRGSLLKTPHQIEKIKESAALNTAVLDAVAEKICIGMSTAEIDQIVYDFTTKHGGIPAPPITARALRKVCAPLSTMRSAMGSRIKILS